MPDYDPSTDPKMQALFEKADAEGLWFHTSYQDLWFSPDELRAEHAEGRFCWGPVNWQLRDPSERLAELESAVNVARRLLENIRRRITKSQHAHA